jgi:hypothetical protein
MSHPGHAGGAFGNVHVGKPTDRDIASFARRSPQCPNLLWRMSYAICFRVRRGAPSVAWSVALTSAGAERTGIRYVPGRHGNLALSYCPLLSCQDKVQPSPKVDLIPCEYHNLFVDMMLLLHSGTYRTSLSTMEGIPGKDMRTSPIPFAAMRLPFATRMPLPGARRKVPVMNALNSCVTCTDAPESRSHKFSLDFFALF